MASAARLARRLAAVERRVELSRAGGTAHARILARLAGISERQRAHGYLPEPLTLESLPPLPSGASPALQKLHDLMTELVERNESNV